MRYKNTPCVLRLLNSYQRCQVVSIMLQCLRTDLKKMCMSSVLSTIRHRLAVKTCADALKSLSTAAELAGVQFNFLKAIATAE